MSKISKRGRAVRKDLRIFYPEYFDKNLSWRMGRRVPMKLAYEDPELKRIALAAQKAGYEVFLDSDKHFSKTWYNGKGRMMVSKVGTKEEQIREIARQIPKVNLPKPTAQKVKDETKKIKKGSVYRQKSR